jgi:hypothetical protein
VFVTYTTRPLCHGAPVADCPAVTAPRRHRAPAVTAPRPSPRPGVMEACVHGRTPHWLLLTHQSHKLLQRHSPAPAIASEQRWLWHPTHKSEGVDSNIAS